MKIIKYLGGLVAILGMFAVVSAASASTADVLQPAGTITYNEELVVNNTMRANSAYIGSTAAGVGGVTFFNGSIVNNAVDDDGESTIPVTFADDVRIDGEIYRTEAGGDDPIKLADTIRPQTNNIYSLGTSTNQFKDAYFAGTVNTERMVIGGEEAGSASLAGDASSPNLIISGDVEVRGDVKQAAGSTGALKAVVQGNEDGTCSNSWTYDGSSVTCTRSEEGYYMVEFAWDISRMFGSATAATATIYTAVKEWDKYTDSEKTFVVRTMDPLTGLVEDSDFVLLMF